MPTVPTNFTNPTGKQNLLASFKNWLNTNIPTSGASDFVYAFLSDVSNPETFPRVGVSEMQFFQPSVSYLGMSVFPAAAYPVATPATDGSLNGTLLQVEIKTDEGKDPGALKKLYQIRDRIRYGLINAGTCKGDTQTVTVPPIIIYDYDNATPNTETGIIAWVPLEQDVAIQEQYIAPGEELPNIHTLKLLVRLEWFELN